MHSSNIQLNSALVRTNRPAGRFFDGGIMELEQSKAAGIIAGFITGALCGAAIANYIIFPAMLGGTITEVLQMLSRVHR